MCNINGLRKLLVFVFCVTVFYLLISVQTAFGDWVLQEGNYVYFSDYTPYASGNDYTYYGLGAAYSEVDGNYCHSFAEAEASVHVEHYDIGKTDKDAYGYSYAASRVEYQWDHWWETSPGGWYSYTVHGEGYMEVTGGSDIVYGSGLNDGDVNPAIEVEVFDYPENPYGSYDVFRWGDGEVGGGWRDVSWNGGLFKPMPDSFSWEYDLPERSRKQDAGNRSRRGRGYTHITGCSRASAGKSEEVDQEITPEEINHRLNADGVPEGRFRFWWGRPSIFIRRMLLTGVQRTHPKCGGSGSIFIRPRQR